jgi:hypothetical protein
MAGLSDTESVSASAGAGSVELAVGPAVPGSTAIAPGEPLELLMSASSAGAPAYIQLSVEEAPDSDPCRTTMQSVEVTVSAAWFPPLAPVPLCTLVDEGGSLVLAHLDPGSPMTDRALELRVDRPGAAPSTAQHWSGTVRFAIVQNPAGFTGAQSLPVEVTAPGAAAPVASGSDVGSIEEPHPSPATEIGSDEDLGAPAETAPDAAAVPPATGAPEEPAGTTPDAAIPPATGTPEDLQGVPAVDSSVGSSADDGR